MEWQKNIHLPKPTYTGDTAKLLIFVVKKIVDIMIFLLYRVVTFTDVMSFVMYGFNLI